MTTPAASEILLTDGTGVVAARVLLRMNAILYRYPSYGVWCYLIRSERGVVVFDAGPKYLSVLGGKGLFRRESGNTRRILAAMTRYFPGQEVSYIAASHYHFDHTENAPHLQSAVSRRQHTVPHIRLHAYEYGEKRFLHIVPSSVSRIYAAAGYGKWKLGEPIRDGESIQGSGFRYLLVPGHTSGNLALVNDDARIFIGGYWAVTGRKVSPFIRFVTRFVDECPSEFAKTDALLMRYRNYRVYTYHPLR